MKNYNLFQTVTGKTKYFYVQFIDDETGLRTSKKSVESLRKKLGIADRHHITKRPEAEFIVQKAIEKGLDGLRDEILL